MNQYAILASIIVFVGSLTGAYFKGRKDERMDALIIQQAANKAAVEALNKLREDLRPKVTNYYRETVKYPDCHATEEGHKALMELYQ